MIPATNLVRRNTSPRALDTLVECNEENEADDIQIHYSSASSSCSDLSTKSSDSESAVPSEVLQVSNSLTVPKKRVFPKSMVFWCAVSVLIVLAAVVSQLTNNHTGASQLGLKRNVRGSAELQTHQHLSVSPEDDAIFANRRLSLQSFEEVRRTYQIETEIQRPMALVRLPDNFQGEYRPSTVEEFMALANELIEDTIDAPKEPSSRYGIVTICIGLDLCNIAEPNQKAYAWDHGYDYLYLSRPIDKVPPKMLKYLVLTWAMNRGYDWLLMLDADALITNSSITLESLVQMPSEYKQEAPLSATENIDLIITRGGNWKNVHAINNGIFLLRNSPWSVRHCFDIFTSRYSYTRFLGRSLVDQPIQLSLLLVQDELRWPPTTEVEMGQHVMVVPKRRLNSFRRNPLHSQNDVEEGGQWERGDFLAHFASNNKYSLMIDLLEEENLPGVPSVEERYSFPLPAPDAGHSQYANAGSCWCENGQINCIPKYHVIGVHKAGSKSLMRYLAGNSALSHSPHVEDPARWLTDSALATEERECNMLREQEKAKLPYHGYPGPVYINKGETAHALKTCSFNDYTLLHGKFTSNKGFCLDGKLPPAKEDLEKPLFDEMVVWERGPSRIRGLALPVLFHRLQPSARMLITVRDAVEVFYSAYNHFGDFGVTKKSPGHFHSFATDLTMHWTEAGCTIANFRTCLPPNLVEGGSWFSRAMYSEHLPLWLDSFGCSQVHIFDVSVDPFEEVQRLYNFVGAPNQEAAFNVTRAAYRIQEEKDKAAIGSAARLNALNKNTYEKILDETQAQLEHFYFPYHRKLCDMMHHHGCLRVPLFLRQCQDF